jgi:hypothetical protein
LSLASPNVTNANAQASDAGRYVWDLTGTSSYLPAGTKVNSVAGTTWTLSANPLTTTPFPIYSNRNNVDNYITIDGNQVPGYPIIDLASSGNVIGTNKIIDKFVSGSTTPTTSVNTTWSFVVSEASGKDYNYIAKQLGVLLGMGAIGAFNTTGQHTIVDNGGFINNAPTNSYHFTPLDQGCTVLGSPTAATNYTIDRDNTALIPIGGLIEVVQATGFVITIVAGTGVTLNGAVVATSGIGTRLRLLKTAVNTWIASV